MNDVGMKLRSGRGRSPMPGSDGEADRLLLTSVEAARVLAISQRTLWTLTEVGDVPCVRLGRVKRYAVDALREWVARNSMSDQERLAASNKH